MAITPLGSSEGGLSVRTKLNTLIGRSTSFIHANADFGCIGNNATDNAAALIAMREAMLTDFSKQYRIYFEPGTYLYTNNRWLFRVSRFEIDAYGVSFQNINTNTHQKQPLFLGGLWDDTGDVAKTRPATLYNGFLFDSAAAGDLTVTLTTPAEHSNFSVGSRVFLHGFCQQFSGFPPNSRYYEFTEVSSIDAETGVITFPTGIKFAYDKRWPDDPEGIVPNGRPRILNLDRDNFKWPEFIYIKGATWLDDATFGRSFLNLCGRTVILEDVESGGYWPQGVENAEIRRCLFRVGLEPDKNISNLLIEDCEVPTRVGGGTNCHRAIIRRNKIYDAFRIGAKLTVYEDNHIFLKTSGSAATLGTPFYTDDAWYRGNTFYNRNQEALAPKIVGIGNDGSESITVDAVDGNNILIPFDATSQSHMRHVAVGHLLRRNDNGNEGRIKAIYHDGGSPGNFVFEGTWHTPVAGEVYVNRWMQRCWDLGGNKVLGGATPAAEMFSARKWVEGARKELWIPAALMQPRATNGCSALTVVENTSTRPNIHVLDFDPASVEYAQFWVSLPDTWDRKEITFRAYWTSAGTATDGVAIGLAGIVLEDNDLANDTFPTAIVVTDGYPSAASNRVAITKESAEVTLANTTTRAPSSYPTAVAFQVSREVADTNDDLSTDMRLIGVMIYWSERPPSDRSLMFY